jgi:hypothetical protein
MSAIHLPWFRADEIARLLSPGAAAAATREALRAGLDPASHPAWAWSTWEGHRAGSGSAARRPTSISSGAKNAANSA